MSSLELCQECGQPISSKHESRICPACLLKARLPLDEPLEVGGPLDSSDWSQSAPRENLEEAKGQDAGQGLPPTVATNIGGFPQVRLQEVDSAPEHSQGLQEAPSDDLDLSGSRFQFLGEIARGGMGSILRVHDPELGRDLALKILLNRHRQNPELVGRFIEEAQISGQLQHPGIVPIHELGTLDEGRPYFTMRLVKGHTLAELLSQRENPQSDLPRYLAIFELICQTVAYAHARGVVHRDLKPSNVMVGSFGEVQVMDWGLAKVLPRKGPMADEPPVGEPVDPWAELPTDPEMEALPPTVVATTRSRDPALDSDLSVIGSILGTPSYMAPEQARGEVWLVDERADVFAIGSILCEILTGLPAFTGKTQEEVYQQTIHGSTESALERLRACGSDPELVALAWHCLASEPMDRPRDAGSVRDRMTAYLAGVRDRLRASELALAVEEARVEEVQRTARFEQRARRLTLTLAAILLGSVVLSGAGYLWQHRTHAERWSRTATAIKVALAESVRLRGLAHSSDDPASRWIEAIAQAQRAADLLRQDGVDPSLRQQVDQTLAKLTREYQVFQEDLQLLDALERARVAIDEFKGPDQVAEAYTRAFQKAGMDLETMGPQASANWLRSRSESAELIKSLDAWLSVRLRAGRSEADLQRLVTLIREADPDPWRDALREMTLSEANNQARRLQDLADDSEGLESQPIASLLLLAQMLLDRADDRKRAGAILQQAWKRSPNDFWVNIELATIHRRDREYAWPRRLLGLRQQEFPHVAESLRYLTAAVAIRPESSNAHNALGYALWVLGRADEAESEFREAIRIDPDHLWTRNTLGAILITQHRPDEAAAEYREAIRIRPEHAWPRINLGRILWKQGKFDEAETELRQALKDNPSDTWAWVSLAGLLQECGQAEEAEAAFREALRLEPDHAIAHCRLGLLLGEMGRFEEAVAELRQGHELGSALPVWLFPSDEWLQQAERRAKLAQRLPAVLLGEDIPTEAGEGLELAIVASQSRYYAASVRLFQEAWDNLPDPPHIPPSRPYLFEAARAAILAADDQGQSPTPKAQRGQLCQQARAWLQQELARLSEQLNQGPPSPELFWTLRRWQNDPKLASIREPEPLANLPKLKQDQWQAFWADVDRLLKEGPLEP